MTTTPNAEVHENHSGVESRRVEHLVLDRRFQKGFHLLLFQDRYKTGQFMMDWQSCEGLTSWDDHARRNWNVLVEVK